MTRLIVAILAAIALVLGGVTVSGAQGHHGFGHHGGGHHGFDHFGVHHGFGAHVFIEPPVFVWPHGYHYYAPSVYWYDPPVVIAPSPRVYQQQPQSYWYYCENPRGYYPYVPQCPGGWMQVVPRTTPPGQ